MHRLLSSRPVYNERDEWSAIAKDSEYEWSFMYAIETEDDTIALASLSDDGFDERLNKAYDKFLSKLKYENYLAIV